MPDKFRIFGADGVPECPGCEGMDIAVREDGYRLFDFVQNDDSVNGRFILLGSHDGVWSDRFLICRDCGGIWPAVAFSDFPQ